MEKELLKYYILFYCNTDEDFTYEFIDGFTKISDHYDYYIYIGEVLVDDSMLEIPEPSSIIEKQLRKMSETVSAKNDELRKDLIRIWSSYYIATEELEFHTTIDENPISLTWSNGNQSGYFQIGLHDSDNLLEELQNLFKNARKLGFQLEPQTGYYYS